MSTINGSEHFIANGNELGFTISDFWKWAYSDLSNSTLRSAMAEYIVASSLGLSDMPSFNNGYRKHSYDLISPDGYRLSVRAAAYVQSEDEQHPDCVSFSIASIGIKSFDVFVFCVYKGLRADQSPTNLDLWDFYLLPPKVVQDNKPNQKTITLPSLMELEPIWCDYYGLGEAIKITMNA